MTNPAATEIVTAMRDFERTLAQQPQSVFAPAWAQTKPPCNVSVIFDPVLSPTLHDKAMRTLHTVKMLGRQARLLLHYPFLPEAGSRPNELSSVGDGDAVAVFVHDVRNNEAQAYVLTDRPRQHTESTVQTDAPRDVWLTRDGRPVIRLTEHFAHSFVWGQDGEPTYVTPANELDPLTTSPAQQFVHRLRFGTLSGDACDARVSARCGGRTLMIVQNCGMTNLCWEFCEHCYDAAIDTAKANYAAAVEAAWANPPMPRWATHE